MKVLYIYLENCGPIRPAEVHLDANWRFAVDKRRISVRHEKSLPNDFWTLKGEACRSVVGVSAMIGSNGAGKTSFAACLSRALSFWEMGSADRYSPDTRCFIVIETETGIRLFRNYDVCFNLNSIEKLPADKKVLFRRDDCRMPTSAKDYESPSQLLRLVYYSPFFTGERTLTASGETQAIGDDLSTTAALAKLEKELQERVMKDGSEQISLIAAYRKQERERVIDFVHFARAKHEKFFKHSGLVAPRFVRYGFNGNLRSVFEPQIVRAAKIDPRYEKIEELVCMSDFAVQSLLFFVWMSFCWHTIIPSPDSPSVSRPFVWLEKRLLDIFLPLLREEDRVLKRAMPEAKLIARRNERVRAAIATLKSLADEVGSRKSSLGEFFNSFDPVECKQGLAAIQKLLVDKKHFKSRYVTGTKDLDLDRIGQKDIESVFRQIDAVAGLYPELDNPLLTSDFDPPVSSGEMNYLTSFARFYNELEKWKRDNRLLLVVFDEAETALHPSLQKLLVLTYMRFFGEFMGKHPVQMHFLSHSPNLLSDIPRNCVSVVRKDAKSECSRIEDFKDETKTFGANIYDLYRNSYFVKNGPMGEFAYAKIAQLFSDVSKLVAIRAAGGRIDEGERNRILQLVHLVGDDGASRYFKGLEDAGLL